MELAGKLTTRGMFSVWSPVCSQGLRVSLAACCEALNIPVVGFILQPHREIEPVSAGYLGIKDGDRTDFVWLICLWKMSLYINHFLIMF